MIHNDKTAEAMGPVCPSCNGTLLITDHQACINRNTDKVPADCDCQHRQGNGLRKWLMWKNCMIG